VDTQVEAEMVGPSTVEQSRQLTKVRVQTAAIVPREDLEQALASVQKTLADNPLFDEINNFDSAVASDMQRTAVLALLASMVAIVLYIWFRFQRVTFGLAAVVALVHDMLITVGLIAAASLLSGTVIGEALLLTDFKINLPMIAAFLTIMGYSLNDTIVVFDRIREVRGKNPALTAEMVNLSLNQTLSRTLLTSFCTFVVVIILYVMGGEGVHGFAFALILGIAIGTFSSIYIASPTLIWLMKRAGAPTGAARAAAQSARV
jgi:SecD/SecF fusion protein